MARVDLALAEFAHPAMHRVLQWDLRHAGIARGHAALLPETWRERVQTAFVHWEQLDWTSLRPGVIHGDANDHNVLAQRDRMTGLLDFGDMVHSAIVCDLAVALAYAMLGERDPLARRRRGDSRLSSPQSAHRCRTARTRALVRARLAASLCYAAHNKIRDPDDPYQVVSEAGVRALFERLDAYPRGAAEETIRAACGTPA